jgi:phenylpropionate dioxygenase-like ring-hydroxylating dioxygenase large terminal subunit
MAPSILRVPLSYYGDEEEFRREEELLVCTPMALVPSARVRNPHDYVVRDVLGRSVLVSRGSDGVVRAFLNYCRHRGARPADGCGSTRRFSCPYHGWTYDSAGQLVGVPGKRGFTEVDWAATGLIELPSEERHGLAWVVLTAGAPLDLDDHLGSLGEELDGWQLGAYEHFTLREFQSEVNWKAALEAFAESYHFPYVHANSLIGQNTIADVAVHQSFGRHHCICFPFPWIRSHDDGETSWDPIDNVAIIYWLFPNLVVAFSNVGVELIDILPEGSSSFSRVRHEWMAKVPPATEDERAGYTDLFGQVHAAVKDEDFGMLPQCGDAIRHAQHDHMIIGRNEIGVQHVVRSMAGAFGYRLPDG